MNVLVGKSGLILSGSRLIALIFAAVLATGCAGLVNPVSEGDRDTSGAYDGRWVATHGFTADTQTVQGWRMNCSAPAESFGLLVADGTLKVAGGEPEVETYVSAGGKFRLEMPTSSEIRESVGSDSSISDGKITMILQGNLSETEPGGLFTMGIAQLGNSGCTSKYSFERI